VIAGNYDEGIGRNSNDCGCAYKTEAERQMGKQSISYTNAAIGPAQRAYLASLPSHIRLEFRDDDFRWNLLLVHGSPRKVNEYLFADREEKSFRRILEEAQADVLCFGHTHRPFHRIFAPPDRHGRYSHAINTGSVGKPKDGDPRGCYALLTIDPGQVLRRPEGLRVEFIRFDYDIEAAARAIEASPLPAAYADMLRSGL